jgi:hypothetical protein
MDKPYIEKSNNINGVKAWQLWILAFLIILFIFTIALIFYVLLTKNISRSKDIKNKVNITKIKN